MKNTIFLVVFLLLASVTLKASDPGDEKSIGFATALPDTKWHLGTEKAIQIVKDLDKAWAKQDFAGMKKFFADTAKCYFADGTITKTSSDFISKINDLYPS